jgi:hypothetical protein
MIFSDFESEKLKMFSIKHVSINISIGNKTLTELFSEWFNQLGIVDKLTGKYNDLNRDELIKTIQECLDGTSPAISFEFRAEGKENPQKIPPDNVRCHHIFRSGSNYSKRCPKKISRDSIQFCYAHKKYDVIVENREIIQLPEYKDNHDTGGEYEPKKKLKKREVSIDDTGTLMDKQGVVYYKEGGIFWAVGRKKKPDSFKIIPLNSRGIKSLIKTFFLFESNEISPIFKVAEFDEERDTNWINMLVESQRDEKTLEVNEDWKEWIKTEYLRMRETCLSGMDSRPFYGTFEIKLPDLPANYELKCINPDDIEDLHEMNLTKEEGFYIDDTKEVTLEFVNLLVNNSPEARKYKYRCGLAYIFYEILTEKEKNNYLSSLHEGEIEGQNFIDMLYKSLQ